MGEQEGQQPQITPKELYERANQVAEAGNATEAINLYEQAGYTYKAIQLSEKTGDIQRAYSLAIKGNDHWSADRIAAAHQIPGHEFFNFPPLPDKDIMETMKLALKSRLREGATASMIGLHGFKDKVVADVGTRDGRFVSIFRDLGAKDVYGIDPDIPELEKAVKAGIIDREHAIATTLEDMPAILKGTFNIATIFNFNIPIVDRNKFIQSVHGALSPSGEVVMTVAEGEVL